MEHSDHPRIVTSARERANVRRAPKTWGRKHVVNKVARKIMVQVELSKYLYIKKGLIKSITFPYRRAKLW